MTDDGHSNSCASFALCVAGSVIIVSCLVALLVNGLIFYVRKVCMNPPDRGEKALHACNQVTAVGTVIITLTGLAMLLEVIIVS